MIVELKMLVNTPATDLWRVMAEQYTDIGNIVSGVYASGILDGECLGGAPVSGRVCYTNMGKHPLIEEITKYDAENFRISYNARSKSFPWFVKHLENNWEFKDHSEFQTEVSMRLEGTLSFPFNLLMGPMMKMRFKKMMPSMVEELAYFARSGEKHPDRVAFDELKGTQKKRQSIDLSPAALAEVKI